VDESLFNAVSAGNVQQVGILVRDEGADPNQVVNRFGREYTVLAWAASHRVPMVDDGRRVAIIELLASEGANPSSGGPLVECTWVDVIEALIGFGALVDQPVLMPDGRKLTPLVARCEELHEDAIC
jgi:hypothetical protein